MNHIYAFSKEQVVRLPSFSLKVIGKRVWSFFKNSAFVASLRSDLTWDQFEQLESKKTIHSFKSF